MRGCTCSYLRALFLFGHGRETDNYQNSTVLTPWSFPFSSLISTAWPRAIFICTYEGFTKWSHEFNTKINQMSDARETWQASMTHIALEGGCFVLSANQFCLRKDYPPPPEYIFSGTDEDLTPDTVVCAGGSVIISPSGAVLAGPDYKGEVLITADLPIILHSKLLLLLLLRFSNVQIVCRYSWRDCPSKVWFRCGGALFKAWCAEPLDLFNLQSMTSLVQFPILNRLVIGPITNRLNQQLD